MKMISGLVLLDFRRLQNLAFFGFCALSLHWLHYQPSSAIAASARARVSCSLSPNNSRKRAGRPSGGPFSMISRMLWFKPMDRSWLRLGTRESATYTTNHLMSLLMRLGNRQWKMRPGSAVAPCSVYSDDASKDVSGTWRRMTLSGYEAPFHSTST